MNSGDLIIVGAGGHCRIVIDAAVSSGYNVLGIIDLGYKGQEERILGINVMGGLDALDNHDASNTSIFIAIGDNDTRKTNFESLTSRGFATPSIVHPTAVLSQHISIGDGTLINAGAVVNAGTEIGECCIINTSASIDHETIIGNFSHIAPGVTIGGRSKVGNSTFLGLGSSIIDFISIGDDVTIGAGSTIIKDVASGSRVVGLGRILE